MIDRLDFKRWHNGALERVQQQALDMQVDDMLGVHTPAFEITNVADLCYRMELFGRDQDGIVLHPEKFPNVAPPFRSYWMEWRCPKNLDPYLTIGRFGIWCVITDRTDDDRWDLICAIFCNERKPRCVGRFELIVSRTGVVSDPGVLHVFPEAVDFLMPHGVPERRRKPSGDSEFVEQVKRAADGMPEKDRRPFLEAQAVATERTAEQARARAEELRTQLAALNGDLAEHLGKAMRVGVLPPLLMAHSLLSCKNVETEDCVPDAKLSKAAVKRRGQALVRFKTLTIRPMGGKADAAERVSIGGGMTALHLVRGHFKTFTVERPLFGSLVGSYWWSPNVRGKEEAGTIVKDYKVSP